MHGEPQGQEAPESDVRGQLKDVMKPLEEKDQEVEVFAANWVLRKSLAADICEGRKRWEIRPESVARRVEVGALIALRYYLPCRAVDREFVMHASRLWRVQRTADG